jgi:hypothetical protein
MKKRILISLSSAVVLVALAIFVIAQTSGTSLVRADKSSGCGDIEVVKSTVSSGDDCCSSSSASVMTADMKADDCSSVAETAAASDCTGVIQAAADAGCPGVSEVVKSSECSSEEKETEGVSGVKVSNETESDCCEGSATAALLIDECCGTCI